MCPGTMKKESKGAQRKSKSTKPPEVGSSGEDVVIAVTKKPKSSRNTEKRRERSKVAARCRRGKESEIFTELSSSLPVSENSKNGLDKASVMRLTLCDLKLKQMLENVEGITEDSSNKDVLEYDSLINSAVSGFVVVCSCDGDVIYVSEGISPCLGLSQYEVMGQSLLEFSHPCDQGDIKEMLLCSSKSGVENRSALFRLKSTNSTRGRNAHHRSTNYKVVNCFGRIFSTELKVVVGGDEPREENQLKQWFVGICEPLLQPQDVDIPLNSQSFLSRHSPDMKFEYVDEGISNFMEYKSSEMIGKSLFDFYHACDGEGVARAFRSLYTKGQTVTERTRFLAKGGGWIWIVTQATTINNNAGKPTSVVCIHFVTSEVECDTEIVSQVQVRDSKEPIIPIKEVIPPIQVAKIPLHESTNLHQKPIPVEEVRPEPVLIANPFTGPVLSKPTPSTAKIFAPRTDDMDSGFLMPVNDTWVVTKDKPEDLLHLAPIAGDEYVSLSNVPLLDELLQWLDEEDMEYTVLEGYDQEPLPLIACAGSVLDSPIPIPLGMTTDISPLVRDDPVLESMAHSPNQCDSPLMIRSTDPSMLSPSDPLLLSPFKAPSPEPFSNNSSPSCAELMSPDLFSTHCYSEHDMIGRGGRTAGASSHKSKAGGGYDDFNGFPMVSDFQEALFSPSNCYYDGVGPPGSPEITVNLMDRSRSGGGLALKNEKVAGSCSVLNSNTQFGVLNKDPPSALGHVKCMARGNDFERSRPINSFQGERPLPCKLSKSSYADEQGNNKAWLQIPTVTPTQPPWMDGGQLSPSIREENVGRKQAQSIASSTRNQTSRQLHRHRQLQMYQHLLKNPSVIQVLINRGLRSAAGGGGTNSRKRNFVGKLLAEGGGLVGGHPFFGGGSTSGGHWTGGGAMLELPKALVELTNQDCEVNAPLESQPLLDGPDLLTALDT